MTASPDRATARAASSARTLRRALVGSVSAIALVLGGAAVWAGWRGAANYLSAEANDHLRDAAGRGQLVVERVLDERTRQVSLLASLPATVDAARDGSRRASAEGLTTVSRAELERRFAATRSLGVSDRTRRWLEEQLAALGFAEIILTDGNGLNVVVTGRPSDMVQADEGWWTRASRGGITGATVERDESAGQEVLEIAAAVRERPRDRAEGVIKVAFAISTLEDALRRAAEDGGPALDVVDGEGRVVASAHGAARMEALAGAAALLRAPVDSIVRYDAASEVRRAALRPVNDGAWRVVAHLDDASILAPLARARLLVLGVGAALLALVLASAWLAGRFVERRVSAPVTELAVVAEAVAGGDLSRPFAPSLADDEIGRLSRATARMIDDLRRLVTTIRDASQATNARAGEITAGSESMAGAAQQMAGTSGELSQRSTEMADAIQVMARDAARLRGIADALASGTEEGVRRNADLMALAAENRARLDASATALETLAADARSSADAIASLAEASEEFGAFVTLVQRMTRQTRLLALNAAMEAARAGEQGHGFAVVAAEVRRLAANSSEAAERTEALVRDVLGKVRASRESSARTVETVAGVLDATRAGRESFAQIEGAVHDSEGWTSSIEGAAQRSRALVAEMNDRLEELARATESYAAAMQEVAASSQEQSASTEEIAAAAAHLANAASHLAALVSAFRLAPAAAPGPPAPIYSLGSATASATQPRLPLAVSTSA